MLIIPSQKHQTQDEYGCLRWFHLKIGLFSVHIVSFCHTTAQPSLAWPGPVVLLSGDGNVDWERRVFVFAGRRIGIPVQAVLSVMSIQAADRFMNGDEVTSAPQIVDLAVRRTCASCALLIARGCPGDCNTLSDAADKDQQQSSPKARKAFSVFSKAR